MERNLKYKSFLIILKYMPHVLALFYIVYTLLQFIEIDSLLLGHIMHLSIASWLFMYLASFVFRYCYIHRLPLYYIATNEIITNIDYYIGIPIEDIELLFLHLAIIGILILWYSYFYFKYKLNSGKLY